MKRQYEIVYIFDSALEEPEVNEHLDRFHEILKSPDNADPITNIAHWGKRALAYPINNKEIGYYVVAQFEAETALLSEFERIIKLDDTVIRYLVVINEGLSVHRPDHGDPTDESDDDDDDDDADLENEEESKAPKPPVESAPVSDAEEDQETTTSGGGE
jgi:small subunit ribosomal protein S6